MLGITTPLQDLLPEDDTANGFDTASAALSISPVHIQRYMEAGETALQAALVRGGAARGGDAKSFVLGFSEPHIEVPIQSFQFAEMTKATPGRYRVRVSAFTHDAQGRSLAFAVKTTRAWQKWIARISTRRLASRRKGCS